EIDPADETEDLDLCQLAGDIEEDEAQEGVEERRVDNEADNEEGWVDERGSMSSGEVVDLERRVMPARRVLTKLRKVTHAVKNSSMKLLPRWREICKDNGLPIRVMPRDVKTRWNSTYDMLKFAIKY
ncbi:hypothetical protein M378DRAFT_63359, partial [Amanita muscaria Koide BX008]